MCRFANHQRSKKHRENAAILRKLLEEEESSQIRSSNADVAPGNQQTSVIDQSDGSNHQLTDSDQSDGGIEDELQHLTVHEHDDCFQDTRVQSTTVVTDTSTLGITAVTSDEDIPLDDTVLVGVANGSDPEDDSPLALLR